MQFFRIAILANALSVLAINSIYGQKCTNDLPIVDVRRYPTIEKDSIYQIELENAIQQYVELNRTILPEYYELRKRIKSEISLDDRILIQELRTLYDQQCEQIIAEMDSVHNRVYKNMKPYAKMHAKMLFELFRAYPDTYAILFNEHGIKKRVISSDASALKNKIVKKYRKLCEDHDPCIREYERKVSESLEKNKVLMPFQAFGIDDHELREECRILNILLLAESLEE
jgi:hypothetical protein